MAQEDWKSAVIIFIMASLFLNYIVLPAQENKIFEISSTHIKYHSNWTTANEELHHVKQLQNAYLLKGIKSLDFSLSLSSLSLDRVKTLLPVMFAPYETIKINLANNPIGSQGAEYILSLIPNGVKTLELSFDSIDADLSLGGILANRLNNLNSLQRLKISLIIGAKNDSILDDYLRFGRLGQRLQSYSLVLIGNGLTEKSVGFLKTHLARANLKELELNFYSNKLGATGAQLVSEAILSQKNLQDLNLDFYFNNITEIGTQALCNSIWEINNPNLKTLSLNLDFNFIKNEGGKAVGQLLSKMTNLRSLNLGVASKNFGYLGFKNLVNGISQLTDLESLSLKCGINRVGLGGAQSTRDMIAKLKKLTQLSLNFYENYIGDEGLIELSKAVASIDSLHSVYLNFGFNDAKGYGLIKSLEILAKKTFSQLSISFSSNEFQDSEINLIKDELKTIIKNTERFELQFMETAISKKKAAQIQKIFDNFSKYGAKKAFVHVNSVITEEEETKYSQNAENREQQLLELKKKDQQSGQSGVKEVVDGQKDTQEDLLVAGNRLEEPILLEQQQLKSNDETINKDEKENPNKQL